MRRGELQQRARRAAGRRCRSPARTRRAGAPGSSSGRPGSRRMPRRAGACSPSHRRPRIAARRRGTRPRRRRTGGGRSQRAVCVVWPARAPPRRSPAIVVVPTPPLAPMNANICPWTAVTCADVTRSMAALSSAAVTGLATHSLTPARMASSISAGSSRAATMMTPVVGCWRSKRGQRRRQRVRIPHVQHDTSGCAAAGCAKREQVRHGRRSACRVRLARAATPGVVDRRADQRDV